MRTFDLGMAPEGTQYDPTIGPVPDPVDSLAGPAIRPIAELIAKAERASGVRPVDDHRWQTARDDGSSGLDAWTVGSGGADPLLGFALLTQGPTTGAIDLVLDPALADDDAVETGTALVEAATSRLRAAGGGEVYLWAYAATGIHERIATACGFAPGRELLQLRVGLPLADRADVATRPFRPGVDDDAWISVNNAAFSWHPEQGSWSLDDLRSRVQEPWFDADGFLVHERDGRMAGFCWTKVHTATDHDPPLGEIYVIAVHPDFHGLGLGRALTVAGLAHLATVVDTGMLYVDGDNAAAVGLYLSLGFTIHHRNQAFRRADVSAR